MSCDDRTALGRAACAETPPQRTAPLDLDSIGVIG
jgi:hypothetical protein